MAKKKKKKKSINKSKKKNIKRKNNHKNTINKKRKKISNNKKKKNTSKNCKNKSAKKKNTKNSSKKKNTSSSKTNNNNNKISKSQTTCKNKKNDTAKKKTNTKEIIQKEKEKLDVSLIIRLIVVIILIFILIYSGYNIAIWLIDNSKTTKIQNEIINNIEIEEIVNDYDENDDNKTTYINVDISSLKETNNDSVGWIQVLGTDINFPIVQSTDNEYYLTHDYLKNANKRGWIFLDYHNDFDNLSKNSIIYGHRNANGSMFGTLKNVLTDEWLENDEYHTIKISSLNYNYLFEVVSVYTISVETYYMTTSFSTEDEYQDFLNTIIARSIYDFDIEVSTDDYLITLSTCTGDGTKRLVVHARLKSYIEKE